MAASSGVEGFMPVAGAPAPEVQDTEEITEAELKKIFYNFDSDGSGSIDNEELRMAMMALGIKVTISSAKKVLAQIDEDGNGTVEWDEFLNFFSLVKDREQLKTMLSEANAKYMDYKAQCLGDPNFQSRFFVPRTEKNISKFSAHQDNVEGVMWLNDTANEFLTVSIDGSIFMWDSTVSGKQKPKTVTNNLPGGIYGLDIVNKGESVLATLGTREEENVVLVDVMSGTTKMKYQGPNVPMYCVKTNVAQTHMVCGAKNGSVCYFDLTKGEPLLNLEGVHEGVVNWCDVSKDGALVATASTDGQIYALDLRAGDLKTAFHVDDAAAGDTVHRCLFRGDKEIVSCGDDFCIKKWDLRNMKNGPVENFLGHTCPVRSIALSPDGNVCCSAANDGTMRLWVVDERKYLQDELEEHTAKIWSLEKERTIVDKKIKAEEKDDTVDTNFDMDKMQAENDALQALVPALDYAYTRSKYVGQCFKERKSMNCVQARLGLEGHTLACTALSWRIHPDDPTMSQIVTGAQDQSSMLFQVKTPSIKTFPRWGLKDDE